MKLVMDWVNFSVGSSMEHNIKSRVRTNIEHCILMEASVVSSWGTLTNGHCPPCVQLSSNLATPVYILLF